MKKIIADVGIIETRIAVLEDDKLVELKYEREHRLVGNIYKGKVKDVIPGMDCAFVEIGLPRSAFLHVSDVHLPGDEETGDEPQQRPVDQVLRPGQDLMVQVTKEPMGSKGARVTTRIALPARFLVLMPKGHLIGVSRTIDSAEERARLRELATKIKPKDMGLIVRTEAEGAQQKELKADLAYLRKIWREIEQAMRKQEAPYMLYQDVSLLYSVIRDMLSDDVDEFIINTSEDYDRARNLVREFAPHLIDRVKKLRGKQPLFAKYGLEEEIEKLYSRRVWLPSGGNVSIDETEALVSIDVNTAKFTGERNLARTVFKTNLEACDEIARQLRLRQLGGQIVIDFIDMESASERRQVQNRLKEALAKDRAKTRVVSFSSLNIVEMTRKRTGESLSKTLTVNCPYCDGRGRTRAPVTLAGEIARRLQQLRDENEGEVSLIVHAHSDVCAALLGENEDGLMELQKALGAQVLLHPDPTAQLDKFQLSSIVAPPPPTKKRKRRRRKKSEDGSPETGDEGASETEQEE